MLAPSDENFEVFTRVLIDYLFRDILLTNYMYLLSTRQITPFEAKMFLIDQLDSPPVANIRLVAYPPYEMFRRVYTSIY